MSPYRHVRHNYSDDDDDDVDSALNSADAGPPYRHSDSGAAGYDRGLDPLAARAARLNAYRAALLRSLQAEQALDNQHAGRFGGSAAGGGGGRSGRNGGGSGGATGGRRAPQRDVYEGGNAYRTHDDRQFRRPSAHAHGRGHRGQRTPESRDIDDEGYY